MIISFQLPALLGNVLKPRLIKLNADAMKFKGWQVGYFHLRNCSCFQIKGTKTY